MKSIVRGFVVVLALTGSAAYTQINPAIAGKSIVTKTNTMPVPSCPLNDPKGCGMGTR